MDEQKKREKKYYSTRAFRASGEEPNWPKGARPRLRVLVDPTAPKEVRSFMCIGTGQSFDKRDLSYVGTVLIDDGELVFHVFEKVSREAW